MKSPKPKTRVREWLSQIEARAANSNISIYKVLERAKVHQPTWSRWKSEQLRPRAEDLFKLEHALSEIEGEAA